MSETLITRGNRWVALREYESYRPRLRVALLISKARIYYTVERPSGERRRIHETQIAKRFATREGAETVVAAFDAAWDRHRPRLDHLRREAERTQHELTAAFDARDADLTAAMRAKPGRGDSVVALPTKRARAQP